MGSISPKSASLMDSSGHEQPSMPKKKHNKRHKKNKQGKESLEESHDIEGHAGA
jgi:hypothetical protein